MQAGNFFIFTYGRSEEEARARKGLAIRASVVDTTEGSFDKKRTRFLLLQGLNCKKLTMYPVGMSTDTGATSLELITVIVDLIADSKCH